MKKNDGKVVVLRSKKRKMGDEIRSLADGLKPRIETILEQKTKLLEDAFETGLEAAERAGLTEDDFFITDDSTRFLLDRFVEPKENGKDCYLCFRTYFPNGRDYGIAMETEWDLEKAGKEVQIQIEFVFPNETERSEVWMEADDDKAETVPQSL